jgi:hypothetical protein
MLLTLPPAVQLHAGLVELAREAINAAVEVRQAGPALDLDPAEMAALLAELRQVQARLGDVVERVAGAVDPIRLAEPAA